MYRRNPVQRASGALPRIRCADLHIAFRRSLVSEPTLPGDNLSSEARAVVSPGKAPRRRKTLRRWWQRLRRRWQETRGLARIVARELIRTKVFDVAAGLAFWSMMSMVPLVMAVVALLSLLRIPSLVPQMLGEVALLVPANALALVEKMIGNILRPHGVVVVFGLASYIWSSTSGFTSMITALNIAYDVTHERSWLRDRIQALLLTFTSGCLLTLSLLAIIAGPHFGHLLGEFVALPRFMEKMWPLLRLAALLICFVLGLELVYFLAPNMRQRFRSTIPGALFATALWFAGSFCLDFYLNHMAHYSRLYGGMGALFGLMFWFYLTSLAILIGGELNAEIAKRRDSLFRGHLQSTQGRRGSPPQKTSPDGSFRPAA